jgi:pimeloyl-ACP methyl ester carboxylesterase
MKLYCISGMGADGRIFSRLSLPASWELVPLVWIEPRRGESLSQYALRLADGIPLGEPFGLLGLSMGGMMAASIAASRRPQVLVLISSIPDPAQLPRYYRWAGKMRLHRLLPPALLRQASLFKRRINREKPENKQLLRTIIRDSDPRFLAWAVEAILGWQGPPPPEGYLHIHGSRDGILPLRLTRPTHVIPGAGHMLILEQAGKVSEILARNL